APSPAHSPAGPARRRSLVGSACARAVLALPRPALLPPAGAQPGADGALRRTAGAGSGRVPRGARRGHVRGARAARCVGGAGSRRPLHADLPHQRAQGPGRPAPGDLRAGHRSGARPGSEAPGSERRHRACPLKEGPSARGPEAPGSGRGGPLRALPAPNPPIEGRSTDAPRRLRLGKGVCYQARSRGPVTGRTSDPPRSRTRMKPNIIVALIVGAVIGFGVSQFVSKRAPDAPSPVAAAPKAPSPTAPSAAPSARPPAPSSITKVSIPDASPFFGPK